MAGSGLLLFLKRTLLDSVLRAKKPAGEVVILQHEVESHKTERVLVCSIQTPPAEIFANLFEDMRVPRWRPVSPKLVLRQLSPAQTGLLGRRPAGGVKNPENGIAKISAGGVCTYLQDPRWILHNFVSARRITTPPVPRSKDSYQYIATQKQQ